MDQLLEEKRLRKPRILVAPLDWGLGHATRCIPIINELLRQECEVWLAGERGQEQLLRTEFPHLPFLSLPGYRVRYARSAAGLLRNILFQTQKILRAIKEEKAWLKKMVKDHGFDTVISDNRYGLYHPAIPCIFVTHQLTIKSPLGNWSEKLLQKRNYSYINRFTECWVPDAAGENNLAGELSHPQKKPVTPVYYIGPLSRFELTMAEEKKGQLLFILSGPEPQRSFLENKIINEIVHYPATATIVRGLPGTASIIPSTDMIKFYNHLPADQLNKEILEAGFVISRCGYSSVMDLVKLQKKSILIPTPGQTEQEYLSGWLSEKRIAFCVSQKEFSLKDTLKSAQQFSYHFPSLYSEQPLKQIISRFISSLSKA